MDIYNDVIKKIKPKFLFRMAGCAISSYLSKPTAISYPVRIEIENGAGCNYKCKMCPLNKISRKRGSLKFAEFKKIYDQITPPFLSLTGYTDSFLNPDIFEMIRYGKQRGSQIKMDTHAMNIKEDYYHKLFESGLDILSISIDGSNQEVYGEIRKGGNLEKVLENVKKIMLHKKAFSSTMKISASVVVQRDNLDDLKNLLALLDSLGFDEINPTPVVEYDIEEYDELLLKHSKERLSEILSGIETITFNTPVHFEALQAYLTDCDNDLLEYILEPCFTPWYNAFITWEGDVVPCCYYYDKQIVFGNVFEQPFSKIWNNEKYKAFRKSLAKKRTHRICRTCRNSERFLYDNFSKIPLVKIFSDRKY